MTMFILPPEDLIPIFINGTFREKLKKNCVGFFMPVCVWVWYLVKIIMAINLYILIFYDNKIRKQFLKIINKL